MDAVSLRRLFHLSKYTRNAIQQCSKYPELARDARRFSNLTSRHSTTYQSTELSRPQRNMRRMAPLSNLAKQRYSSSIRPDQTQLDTTPGEAGTAESFKGAFPNIRQQAPKDVPAPEPNERGEVPAYDLTFTCKPCKTRSTHRISKHGYHNGTVLITCPECKNRHVISDHLKIFNDNKKSFEQILKEKGELLKTGVLDPDRDIELWDDGSQTKRKDTASASEH